MSLSSNPRPPEEVLFIPAAFWNSDGDDHPAEAMVVVEDATMIVFSRHDGTQLRLLLTELDALVVFVVKEVRRQEEESGEDDDEEDINLILRITGA